MNFTDKVVVVTGGASGIGRACARIFSERHAAVAVLDRQQTTAKEICGRGRAEFFRVDVSEHQEVKSVVDEIISKFGAIDILVHCAGVQRYGAVTNTSEDEWRECLKINLDGAFNMSKFSIPEMIKRGAGSVVITGSTQSVAAHRNSAAYVASKHAVLGLTRSIAVDYAKNKIRANCVLPGAIDTPMLRQGASLDAQPEKVIQACQQLALLGRMGSPEEVAHVIVFLASDLASFVTGSAVVVDGGQLVPIGGTAFQESGTGAQSAIWDC